MNNKEFYEMRRAYQREMEEELFRVMGEMEDRGIYSVKPAFNVGKRFVSVENRDDYSVRQIYRTFFEVPANINLNSIVKWFLHETKFHEVTVWVDGFNPATLRCDRDIKWYFDRMEA